MDQKRAFAAFGALAQETRMALLRNRRHRREGDTREGGER